MSKSRLCSSSNPLSFSPSLKPPSCSSLPKKHVDACLAHVSADPFPWPLDEEDLAPSEGDARIRLEGQGISGSRQVRAQVFQGHPQPVLVALAVALHLLSAFQFQVIVSVRRRCRAPHYVCDVPKLPYRPQWCLCFLTGDFDTVPNSRQSAMRLQSETWRKIFGRR